MQTEESLDMTAAQPIRRRKRICSWTILVAQFLLLMSIFFLTQSASAMPDDERELRAVDASTAKISDKIQRLSRYISAHPESSLIIGYRAQLYNVTTSYAETLKDMTRYFELKKGPHPPAIYKVRGHALLNLHRPLEALEDFKTAHRISPKDGETIYLRGRALENLDRLLDAKADYTEATSLKEYRAYLNKASVELKLNQTHRAGRDMVSYVKHSKDIGTVVSQITNIFMTGEFKKTLILCDAFESANLHYQDIEIMRAECLFQLGQCEELQKEPGNNFSASRMKRLKELKKTCKPLPQNSSR
ncbi:MAG: hypothetical protein SGJ27_12490 [Candidatus Melainabacteria bacterium]|nr:hypothetical protein [Candidatus Melainabacteria bacterium]